MSKPTSWYSKYGPLRRGDWNEDKTKRFWGYYKGREGWLTPEGYDEAKQRTALWMSVANYDMNLVKLLRKERRELHAA